MIQTVQNRSTALCKADGNGFDASMQLIFHYFNVDFVSETPHCILSINQINLITLFPRVTHARNTGSVTVRGLI